jgi:hypothetical protein
MVNNIELTENGNQIFITKENKDSYIKSIVDYYAYDRVQDQTQAFINSFLSIIPFEICSVFTVDEFEQVLFGQKEISIEDWKSNTYFKGKYS